MSECVVRMEMPESCKKCKNPLCIWCDDDGDFIVDHTIAAVQDFRKKNDDGFPDFCPIIYQLPERHGRLVDADAIEYLISENGCQDDVAYRYDINEMPTIVPADTAERSET